MANKTKQNKKIIEIQTDNSIKNVWVDNIILAVRSDGVCLVRLSTGLPEGNIEQVRFMTSESQLKEFIKMICSEINYYPSKKATAPKAKNAKKIAAH